MDQVLSNRKEITKGAEQARPYSRQVDWRFLLPSPRFGSVALIEPIQTELVEALVPFSDGYRIVNPFDRNQLHGSYDLLVLQAPHPTTVQQVKTILKPGGSLYLEARNWFSKLVNHEISIEQGQHANQQFHSAVSYIKVLKLAGFSEIELYWVWPDFDNPTKFVALDGPAALIYALSQNKAGWLPRTKSLLAKIAVISGSILHLVPDFCIIAQRGLA